MKVAIDPRKKRREMQNALGDNILRYITELLTNSDDSYKRLEADFPEKKNDNVIYISLETERRNDGYLLSVTDHAEGMSKETLEKNLELMLVIMPEGYLHTLGEFLVKALQMF